TTTRVTDQSHLLFDPDVRVCENPDAGAGRYRRISPAPDDGKYRTRDHPDTIPLRGHRARGRVEPGVSESADECRRQVLRGIRQSRCLPGVFVSAVRGGEFLSHALDAVAR